ncbi:hypothetical protein [Pseudomonas sp. GOM6]|uniref:hypothetical protein n=1 Tax=Pseudomonas sp. GOM6 TaxID=3036944 RepID=UPI00240933C0|nr:hypothetical protein [Pseudomonas sp. GOM6]MDG1581009.1 hypothetical protein [Pseudomonas sp. GOM6]
MDPTESTFAGYVAEYLICQTLHAQLGAGIEEQLVTLPLTLIGHDELCLPTHPILGVIRLPASTDGDTRYSIGFVPGGAGFVVTPESWLSLEWHWWATPDSFRGSLSWSWESAIEVS